jgi:hypothetical protein
MLDSQRLQSLQRGGVIAALKNCCASDEQVGAGCCTPRNGFLANAAIHFQKRVEVATSP